MEIANDLHQYAGANCVGCLLNRLHILLQLIDSSMQGLQVALQPLLQHLLVPPHLLEKGRLLNLQEVVQGLEVAVYTVPQLSSQFLLKSEKHQHDNLSQQEMLHFKWSPILEQTYFYCVHLFLIFSYHGNHFFLL